MSRSFSRVAGNSRWQESFTKLIDSLTKVYATVVDKTRVTDTRGKGKPSACQQPLVNDMRWRDTTRHDITWHDTTWLQKRSDKTNHCNAISLRRSSTTVVNDKGQQLLSTTREDEPTWLTRQMSTTLANSLLIPLDSLSIVKEVRFRN